LTGCAGIFASRMDLDNIHDVYVADFHSNDPEMCRPSDVPLNHSRARKFFQRARIVDYRTIHDHYDVAPCYAEGTFSYQSQVCDWTIDAGAIAEIKCGKHTWYAVCDDCKDLFEDTTPK
jgi:hypothetical protein